MKTERTLSFPEKKAAAKRPFDLKSLNSSAYSALSQNEPINYRTVSLAPIYLSFCSNLLNNNWPEFNSQRRQNFSYRSKFGIPCRAKRFVKTFSGQAAFPCYFSHAFGLCYVKDGRLNQRTVARIFCKARLQVQSVVLFAFQIVNRVIRFAKLDLVHRLNLHFQQYLFCSFDVLGLSFFRTSKQKQNNDLSPACEINSVSRAEINLALYDTLPDRTCLTKVTVCHIPQPGINPLEGSPVIGLKGFQPLLKIFCWIKTEFFSFLKHNVSYISVNCSLHYTVIIVSSLLLYTGTCQADDFGELAKRCAPSVAEDTLRAIVKTESGFNPYAIGVVKGKVKQPRAYHEAMSTIAGLELSGADYSVGLAQINRKNFSKYGISASQALDACTNLKVASRILSACFKSAKQSPASDGKALHDALSCYYSGNFKTGYRHGYVDKVRSNAGLSPLSVPSIREVEVSKPQQSLIAEGVPGKSSGLIF